MSRSKPRCELLHHGVAANSSPKTIACIPSSLSSPNTNEHNTSTDLVYASHLMLNVARPRQITIKNDDNDDDGGGICCDGTSDKNFNSNIERIWKVENTLRTSTSLTEAETATAAANISTLTAKRVITCVVRLKYYHPQCSFKHKRTTDCEEFDVVVLVCGFSDGTMTSWIRKGDEWKECVLLASAADRKDNNVKSSEDSVEEISAVAMQGRSITDIDGFISHENDNENENDNNKILRRLSLSVCACSSRGAQYFRFILSTDKIFDQQQHYPKYATIKETKQVISTPSNVVRFNALGVQFTDINNQNGDCNDYGNGGFGVFLVGTAAPRYNKIHVLMVPTYDAGNGRQLTAPIHSGSLTGHEDWITCFDWTIYNHRYHEGDDNDDYSTNDCCYVASGSQDAKIRLWKWVTVTARTTAEEKDLGFSKPFNLGEDGIDDEGENDLEEIEGEARLEIAQSKYCYDGDKYQSMTSVYLEALLIGHEEMVTSVAWHPNPKSLFNQDLVLISSSMDRSILLWCCSGVNDANMNSDGAWLPIARVGSPSGILGGPVGASLLGYLNVQVEPKFGRWIMGHAYGGSLHFFSAEHDFPENESIEGSRQSLPTFESSTVVQWKAQPCITGHFDEVTDICWEGVTGEYLISVSDDATCRLWAPMNTSLDTWIEIARPQVHGYNLSAVTSLSTIDNKHRLVTGADEKELRVFDGTRSFLRMLHLLMGKRQDREEDNSNADHIHRVDRAYMPSLGLSNKDTAADGADEDTSGGSALSTLLPLERDLGSTSLWPEIRKLFGHNSEIARLASTVSAQTCKSAVFTTPFIHQSLVASSTKARDVIAANIRIWDVDRNRCLQVLHGGHRSTVTALSFSPDGTYLASSGKDRRLCIWKRNDDDNYTDKNDLFVLASAKNSSHKRIVWSVHFCPYRPTILATGSRDGSIKIWEIIEGDDGATSLNEYSKFVPSVDSAANGKSNNNKPEAVTSLAFSPTTLLDTSRGILAVGLENGVIQMWSVSIGNCSDEIDTKPPSHLITFDSQFCHIGAVKKLAWRPISDNDNNGSSILASCSSDHGLRILKWVHE